MFVLNVACLLALLNNSAYIDEFAHLTLTIVPTSINFDNELRIVPTSMNLCIPNWE